MCAIDDCEPWKVSRSEKRKARKEHTCTECLRKIRPGEHYQHLSGRTDDAGWQTFRTCRHCEAAGAWLRVMCDGYPLTMLLEELDEHRREYPSPVLDQLADSVRSKWHSGSDPVPDVEATETDARRCLGSLVT